MPPRLMSFAGLTLVIISCVLMSSSRSSIRWRTIFWGFGLTLFFGLLILKTYPQQIFSAADSLVHGIYSYSDYGSRFLFGELSRQRDFALLSMGSTIIFVSSLMSVLNYVRVIPALMYLLARLMQFTMKTSGSETLASAMQILMGIEAVTGLKAVIPRMTRSELFAVMTCFMSNIAGSVMAVYVGVFGANAGHILTASVMSAPAALALAKIIYPEEEISETGDKVEWRCLIPQDRGIIEAAANGAIDGLKLTASIGAILLAFVSIIHLLNGGLGLVGTSFEELGGLLFSPVAFFLGIPWDECLNAGKLLAIKTIFNEWLAYGRLHEMVDANLLCPTIRYDIDLCLVQLRQFR